jgi:DNA-binding MarR family transcriptional regulator
MKLNRVFPRVADVPAHGFIIENYVPYQLALLSNKLSRALETVCQSECGISRNEWRVLVLIGQSGVCAASSLVEKKVMDPVAVHRAVKKLETAELISKDQSQNDGRVRLLVLTKKGRQVYEKLVPYAIELERRLMAALNADESEQLKSNLGTLLARSFGPPFESGTAGSD